MSITHYIVIGIGALTIAMIALLVHTDHYQRRRRERRVAFGRKHGFEPLPRESGPETRFRFPRGIELYETTLGLNSSFENALSARREHADTLLVDYTYQQPGGGERTYKKDFTLCHFESPRLDLPSFRIHAEPLVLKAAALLGYQDIDLDHSPEFSKRFVLRGPNEAALRDFFTPEVTAHLLRMPRKIWIEGDGNVLLVTRNDGFIPEKSLRLFLRQAESALRLFTR